MVERPFRMREVPGSIPGFSKIYRCVQLLIFHPPISFLETSCKESHTPFNNAQFFASLIGQPTTTLSKLMFTKTCSNDCFYAL